MAFAALLAAVLSAGTQPRFEPQSLAFWDARHGLVQGYALRGGREQAVWLTADGGRTWRTVQRGPGPYWIAAVRGGSDGWIALPGALLHSGDRGRTWSTFSRARVWKPSFATATDGWALSRSGLVATHDGGVTWHVLRQPCGPTFWTSPPRLSLAAPSSGWLLCVSTPGAGEQLKSVYETRDGGRSWRLRSSSWVGKRRLGNVPAVGYADGISFLPNGHGWLPESRGSFYETRDRGRHWRPLPISRPESVEAHAAELLDERVGVALFFYVRRLAFTRDGGQTWRFGYRFR
jgi:photosystem II stability/assembly factor-like uncharacterized protein